jgi:hypothetical protein
VRLASGAAVCLAAAVSACSSPSPPAGSPPSTADPSATATRPAPPAFEFTVAGERPVLPNGSQDTHASTPTARCNGTTLAADRALGTKLASGFALAGFTAAAQLMRHFLGGTGTAVDYRAGSPISRKALASSAFRAMDSEVQKAVLRQLKAGKTQVKLSAAQLPLVAFESATSDLYWGFRGTQGLSVTGRGRRENGRYSGTLTYVIRDSYGFPARDRLAGFGAPMRYLQTVCGAPRHRSGAHWFRDSITVTVPFDRPR